MLLQRVAVLISRLVQRSKPAAAAHLASCAAPWLASCHVRRGRRARQAAGTAGMTKHTGCARFSERRLDAEPRCWQRALATLLASRADLTTQAAQISAHGLRRSVLRAAAAHNSLRLLWRWLAATACCVLAPIAACAKGGCSAKAAGSAGTVMLSARCAAGAKVGSRAQSRTPRVGGSVRRQRPAAGARAALRRLGHGRPRA